MNQEEYEARQKIFEEQQELNDILWRIAQIIYEIDENISRAKRDEPASSWMSTNVSPETRQAYHDLVKDMMIHGEASKISEKITNAHLRSNKNMRLEFERNNILCSLILFLLKYSGIEPSTARNEEEKAIRAK